MAGPDFSSRGRPVEQSGPDFSSRGRPAGQKPNYVIPKRVKVGPVELNLTDANDAQRLATQGFAFGQSPRIMGAMGAVMGLPDAVRQGRLDPIAEAYRQNRQAEIDAIDKARARTGLMGTGIEIAGGLVTGGTIAKTGGEVLAAVAPRAVPRVAAALAPRAGSAASKVARFGGRTAVAATGGAVAGGAYGSGEGRGAEGALYGAVGGAAAEPIVRSGAAVYRGARRLVRKPVVKPNVTAARKLAERLSPDAQARIDEAARLGADPLAVVDVLNNGGRRLVRGVAGNTTDEAQQMAVDYATRTREALPDRALGVVRKLTGRDVDLAALRQQADDSLTAVDNANYKALEPLRVRVDTPLLDDLATNQSVSGLNRSARASNTDRRFQDETNLNLVAEALRRERRAQALGTDVSLQALEDVYRIMRDRAIGMMADQSAAATRREGFALMQEAERLGQSLSNRFPAIADARMASRQARQNIEAIDTGFEAFTPNRVPSELAADIGQLPARRNVLAGAQARLQQQVGENPMAAMTSLGYRPNMGTRLNAMGAPADDMVAAAQIETRRMRNADFISPNTGSQTQLRANDLPDIGGIPTTTMGWTTKLMDFAFRRINAFTPDELDAIVRMGIEPADLQALQALAARDPDKIPSVVKGLLGTAGGIGVGGQINASGTNRGYPQ